MYESYMICSNRLSACLCGVNVPDRAG